MSEYLLALAQGAGNVFSFPNILIPMLGTVIAMISAFLPGIGGTSLATLMLLLTLNWDPVQVLLLFGALTGGATYMGSITAILFNIPGNASSAAVLLDGHPMSRMGLPKTAIAAAATASAVGSVLGVLVLICILPIVRPFILQFGPLERLLLGLWGLTTIIALPNRSVSKALAATLLGLLLAMVGSDPTSGQSRWTFGSFSLYDGLPVIAVLLGFFTLSEVMSWRAQVSLSGSMQSKNQRDSTRAGIRSVFTHLGVTLRSSVLGTLVGVIPGVGGTVASFVAYGQTVQATKGDRSQFGKGDIRGLIAPEAAVDAKDGGSLLPLLAFGLPGSEAGVILLSVLMIHGFVPGLPMLTTELTFSFTLIVALLFSNIMTSAVGITSAPYLARLTSLRIDRIVLPVLVASLVTVVQLHGSVTDLYIAVFFGVLGYLFGQFDWPRIPFVIAFVLGGFIEDNFALSQELHRVDRLDIWGRPIAFVILGLIVFSLLWMVRKGDGNGASPKVKAHMPRGLATLFAGGLTTIAGVLLLISVQNGAGYSLFAQSVAALTTVVCLIVTLRAWRKKPGADAAALVGLPETHRLPLALVCLLPLGVFALGLPVATGLFAAAWYCKWQSLTRRVALGSLLVGLICAAAAWYYLDEVAIVLLPDPAVTWLWRN
jgi:putative tricarboxylic transport membrane protein